MLSVLPLSDHDFHLHKDNSGMHYSMLQYEWAVPGTPRLCNCGKLISVDHAMMCHMGGFVPYTTMKSETLPQRCIQMLQLSRFYNHSHDKDCTLLLLMQMMMVHDLTFLKEVSEMSTRMPFLFKVVSPKCSSYRSSSAQK